jgi:hypothetical protein
MDRRVKQFREGARRENHGRRGHRYSGELRELAVGFAAEKRREGWSLARAAEQLGVPAMSLTRWIRARGVREAFRKVELVADSAAERSQLVLVTPEGFRIEGLGVDNARVLLEVLR